MYINANYRQRHEHQGREQAERQKQHLFIKKSFEFVKNNLFSHE